LQQHMERIMREQWHEQLSRPHNAHSDTALGSNGRVCISPPSESAASQVTTSELEDAAQAAARLPPSPRSSVTLSAARTSADFEGPAVHPTAASAGSQLSSRDCPTRGTESRDQRSNSGSSWGFGRSRHGAQSDTQSQLEDRVSIVSSTGSGSSRRSLSKSLLGAIKSVKYSMVSLKADNGQGLQVN
jgi:hypothetical protein